MVVLLGRARRAGVGILGTAASRTALSAAFPAVPRALAGPAANPSKSARIYGECARMERALRNRSRNWRSASRDRPWMGAR
jgi:hypothetical protein